MAVLLVVVLVTAWAAGTQRSGPDPTGGPAGGTDAVRLGPGPGEDVTAYLARVAAVPEPGDPAPRLALVQFDASLAPGSAAAAVGNVTPLRAVVRVPFPRVQTALREIDLQPAPPEAALRAALTTAAGQATQDATVAAPGTRRAAVAAAEAAALGRPDCACLVAVVVRVAPADVPALRARPGVRAVQVALPDATRTRLAVSPLLPEQGPGRADGPVVGPVPDDGPVPPTG
ncbi:hypothetical protein [Actinomycetospora soli]|uniref:hypothetical protein n=1 Tax=Actinomycetospora soli TaxID=2893887 RepID=UPI001E2D02AB|nr:hypothetical protein [Actinomycetospora soli]MCD2190076.1 hypothetical protein [Actinomycetospora soli]